MHPNFGRTHRRAPANPEPPYPSVILSHHDHPPAPGGPASHDVHMDAVGDDPNSIHPHPPSESKSESSTSVTDLDVSDMDDIMAPEHKYDHEDSGVDESSGATCDAPVDGSDSTSSQLVSDSVSSTAAVRDIDPSFWTGGGLDADHSIRDWVSLYISSLQASRHLSDDTVKDFLKCINRLSCLLTESNRLKWTLHGIRKHIGDISNSKVRFLSSTSGIASSSGSHHGQVLNKVPVPRVRGPIQYTEYIVCPHEDCGRIYKPDEAKASQFKCTNDNPDDDTKSCGTSLMKPTKARALALLTGIDSPHVAPDVIDESGSSTNSTKTKQKKRRRAESVDATQPDPDPDPKIKKKKKKKKKEKKKETIKDVPFLCYPYIGIIPLLRHLLLRPYIEEWLDYPYSNRRTVGEDSSVVRKDEYLDVFDGKVWKDFVDRGFLGETGKNESIIRIGAILNYDGFNPFKRSQVSIGAIYLILANLPRRLRYRREHMLLLATTPNDSGNMQELLRPLVDELTQLHEGVMIRTHKYPEGRLIKLVLIGVSADLPANRSICGHVSYNSIQGCNKCHGHFGYTKAETKESGKKNPAGRRLYHLATNDDVLNKRREASREKERAEEIHACRNKKEREDLIKKYGVNYSPLLRLPYWDTVRHSIIDPMHNLLLGVCRHFFDWLTTNQSVFDKASQEYIPNVSKFLEWMDTDEGKAIAADIENEEFDRHMMPKSDKSSEGANAGDFSDQKIASAAAVSKSGRSGIRTSTSASAKAPKPKKANVPSKAASESANPKPDAKNSFKSVLRKPMLTDKHLTKINGILTSVSAPSDVVASRNLGISTGQVTAQEWLSWTLSYSEIVFHQIGIPRSVLWIWTHFVRGCRLIFRPMITKQDIEKAHEFFVKFEAEEVLKDYGPPHGYWTFPTERWNGLLSDYTTNNKNMETAFMKRFTQHFGIHHAIDTRLHEYAGHPTTQDRNSFRVCKQDFMDVQNVMNKSLGIPADDKNFQDLIDGVQIDGVQYRTFLDLNKNTSKAVLGCEKFPGGPVGVTRKFPGGPVGVTRPRVEDLASMAKKKEYYGEGGERDNYTTMLHTYYRKQLIQLTEQNDSIPRQYHSDQSDTSIEIFDRLQIGAERYGSLRNLDHIKSAYIQVEWNMMLGKAGDGTDVAEPVRWIGVIDHFLRHKIKYSEGKDESKEATCTLAYIRWYYAADVKYQIPWDNVAEQRREKIKKNKRSSIKAYQDPLSPIKFMKEACLLNDECFLPVQRLAGRVAVLAPHPDPKEAADMPFLFACPLPDKTYTIT